MYTIRRHCYVYGGNLDGGLELSKNVPIRNYKIFSYPDTIDFIESYAAKMATISFRNNVFSIF
jgi:hypothetical protein